MTEFASRTQRKSRITRRNSRRDTGRFWVLGRKRSGLVDLLLTPPPSRRRTGLYSQRNGTAIQRIWSSSVEKYQCFESWNPEEEVRIRNCSLQWRFVKHRTLVPNDSFCKSAQYLRSSGELVSTIRFDRRREGRANLSVDKKILTSLPPEEVQLLVDKGIWKQFARKHIELRSAVQWNSDHTAM